MGYHEQAKRLAERLNRLVRVLDVEDVMEIYDETSKHFRLNVLREKHKGTPKYDREQAWGTTSPSTDD